MCELEINPGSLYILKHSEGAMVTVLIYFHKENEKLFSMSYTVGNG